MCSQKEEDGEKIDALLQYCHFALRILPKLQAPIPEWAIIENYF